MVAVVISDPAGIVGRQHIAVFELDARRIPAVAFKIEHAHGLAPCLPLIRADPSVDSPRLHPIAIGQQKAAITQTDEVRRMLLRARHLGDFCPRMRVIIRLIQAKAIEAGRGQPLSGAQMQGRHLVRSVFFRQQYRVAPRLAVIGRPEEPRPILPINRRSQLPVIAAQNIAEGHSMLPVRQAWKRCAIDRPSAPAIRGPADPKRKNLTPAFAVKRPRPSRNQDEQVAVPG